MQLCCYAIPKTKRQRKVHDGVHLSPLLKSVLLLKPTTIRPCFKETPRCQFLDNGTCCK